MEEHDEKFLPPEDGSVATAVESDDAVEEDPAACKPLLQQLIESIHVDPMTGKYTIPRDPVESDFATFVIMGPAGIKHRVTVNPTEYLLQAMQGGVPRNMPVTGTAITVKFDEGRYRTSDPNRWVGLLDTNKGFGLEFCADPDDPTHFWEAVGLLKKEKVVTTRVVREVNAVETAQIVKGARTTRDRPIPAMRG